jgi:hypothetical protein
MVQRNRQASHSVIFSIFARLYCAGSISTRFVDITINGNAAQTSHSSCYRSLDRYARTKMMVILLYYSDQLFTNFVILVSEKIEKFPFDLWRILNASFFPGCDV